MSESEMVEVNPLQLSLDEVIAMNNAKNKAEAEEEECVSLHSYISRKSYRPNGPRPKTPYNRPNGAVTNLFTNRAHQINDRLRNIPGFGTKPIHQRLGYFRSMKKRRNYHSPQVMAQRIGFRARFNHWVKSQMNNNNLKNPFKSFRNPNAMRSPFVSPLTRNSVFTFNRLNGNNYAGSQNGSISSLKTNIVRHSIRKCLNPSIQREMQELGPGMTDIDLDILESFQPPTDGTMCTTNERFSTYF